MKNSSVEKGNINIFKSNKVKNNKVGKVGITATYNKVY